MQKVEHIGIAVKDLSQAVPFFEKLLNTDCYKKEFVEGEKVTTAFFRAGETKIELLEATDDTSVIKKFIDKKGEGIHHIALAVADIETEIKRLVAQGYTLLQDRPKPGADNKLVCFLHPKDSFGVLIELCMEKK
jgi:methylmalonyl-CoA/ethylmalonyl-CoA epimerase